jgi:hypothetical protein
VSKTDPFRQGCVITLGRGTSPLYPVEALFNYLDVRGGASGPLYLSRSNGSPLNRTYLTERLRGLLPSAGIYGHFSSNSFRIGAATSAALAGVLYHMIQTLGRGLVPHIYRTFVLRGAFYPS